MLNIIKEVPDYRRLSFGNVRHKGQDILWLNIIGTLSGHSTRASKILFAQQNLRKFQSMGMLPNGVPSEATLCRFDKGLDPVEFAKTLEKVADRLLPKRKGKGLKVISVDGKCMRGTVLDNGRCPDVVSAYSASDRATLATEMCEEKSNEIKAVPKLIDKLDVDFGNCVITADAMACQKNIVDKIREKGGHFLIEVKGNQKTLRWNIEDNVLKSKCIDMFRDDAKLSNGRIESRACGVYNGDDVIADKTKWGEQLRVLKICTTTTDKKTGREVSEKRFYMTDLTCKAKILNSLSRTHWSIESMHWVLDTVYHQDRIKRKEKNAARNLDTVQRFCLSIIAVWKSIRKKKSDKEVGVTRLTDKFRSDFCYLRRFLSLK